LAHSQTFNALLTGTSKAPSTSNNNSKNNLFVLVLIGDNFRLRP
jgi:hypothetical protein